MKLQPITTYLWPVTYRYEVFTDWGGTQHELTVDVPALRNQLERTAMLGRLLWAAAIAPAISRDAVLHRVWSAPWRGVGVPLPVETFGIRGLQLHRGTAREDAGQLVLMTGHNDGLGRRRLFLPSVPRSWVHEGLLSPDGFEGLLTHVRGMYMGLQRLPPNTQLQWLNAYVGYGDPEPGNLWGVWFRAVTSVRVCWHTDKAPDYSGGIWP